VPGLSVRFRNAGHILGSAIVDLTYTRNGESRKLVFSGDLGYRDAPVMEPPSKVRTADIVMMESTYGDRLHRPYDETISELADVFSKARAAGGNILIPAFAVGRTQDLLYLLTKHCDEWCLRDWKVFLDSPMAIQATEVYSRHQDLYDAKFFESGTYQPKLPNFYMTRSTEESMVINRVESGAIIIAGSGMCSGGRIRHHLKNNIWRPDCHVVIVGFQAYGTLGRRLVDGAEEIRLWGDTYRVRSEIHTIGGLSAHGDQADLLDWYGSFDHGPPVYLVHGEPKAQVSLAAKLGEQYRVQASIAGYGQKIEIAGR
jgi:metallo-beta-lactamase family protein